MKRYSKPCNGCQGLHEKIYGVERPTMLELVIEDDSMGQQIFNFDTKMAVVAQSIWFFNFARKYTFTIIVTIMVMMSMMLMRIMFWSFWSFCFGSALLGICWKYSKDIPILQNYCLVRFTKTTSRLLFLTCCTFITLPQRIFHRWRKKNNE